MIKKFAVFGFIVLSVVSLSACSQFDPYTPPDGDGFPYTAKHEDMNRDGTVDRILWHRASPQPTNRVFLDTDFDGILDKEIICGTNTVENSIRVKVEGSF